MFESLISGETVFPVSMINPDIKKTLCISGHRKNKIIPYMQDIAYSQITYSAVKLMLYRYIDMAVECGYEIFISGLAGGTDLWAAEYVIEKKKRNSRIKLISMMPFLKHAEFFSSYDKKILAEIEKGSDYLVTVNENPDIIYGKRTSENCSPNLYRDRNYCMVDKSSAVIAFYDNKSTFSGTSQTINYAYRNGRKIYSFGMKNIFDVLDKSGTDIRSIGQEIAFIKNVFDVPQ
ncbi:MAG: DUF1273 domain-containing protein [Ruminococcus sp.]|nr:DUF1273 domain-containing protein [Ruminococcus sp.]